FGRKKGLTTLITLVLTGLVIFTVFVPSILAGMNIYAMAVVVCLYVIVTTLVILNGFNRKTLTAIFGCFSGILAAAAVMGLMDTSLHLTGMISDEAMYLTYLPLDHSIDLKAIIFSGMIIGAMGAVMDVAMSISSSLWEIKRNSRAIAAKGLFASGMAIGRDIMGTMANTLILAYIGSSLSTVLLLIVYDPSLMFLLNREMIIVEILQALVGSFGILFAVPLTALAAALIYTRKKQLPEKPRDSIDT
ncbi:MAG TPA: YibE/F family protein, partial [Eubacteriaceae bacterium]|nr:YibE/F family protein [Eubacteriaceae bacterium]